MIKELGKFFDCRRFLEGKIFVFKEAKDWIEDGNVVGSRVSLVIEKDNTAYSEPNISNVYEKITFKVKGKSFDIPVGAVVAPVNANANLYLGKNEYGYTEMKLSAFCDDLKRVSASRS